MEGRDGRVTLEASATCGNSLIKIVLVKRDERTTALAMGHEAPCRDCEHTRMSQEWRATAALLVDCQQD